jgi:predicted nucleic acid-binding protein
VLYLDSSALVKHYVRESGTDSLNAKLAAEESAGHSLFTSALTFAEVHHALANKLKDKTLSAVAFHQAKQNFEMDWMNQLTVIELGPNILGFIPEIFERTLLKSSEAVHLASAFWIRDLFRLSSKYGPRGSTVTFTTSDRSLVRAAAASNLETFNPQMNQLP